jgi:lysophospholipase L1-like esterase
MALLIGDGEKLVMTGDSITDCGRARPVGEGGGEGLGRGYVTIVGAVLGAFHPERLIRVVNTGTSGDQVRHLRKRWKAEVLNLHPDWLSVMIGINDVWRGFDQPQMKELHVPLAEYEESLDELVAEAAKVVRGLVLMTPYFLEPNRADPMRIAMDERCDAVKRVAMARKAIFVDTQAAFDRLLAHRHPMSIAWDRIHPEAVGHMVIARAFLEGIGFEWTGGENGTITGKEAARLDTHARSGS